MATVVGLFDTRDEAESAIDRLGELGIDRDRMSVAMKDRKESAAFAGSSGSRDLRGGVATAGVDSGGGLGVLAGPTVASNAVVMPGVGTFVIGGPLAEALSGAGYGSASGRLIGGLVGAGLPSAEAEHFSAGMERGFVLVAAQVSDPDAAVARQVLDEEGSLRTYAR